MTREQTDKQCQIRTGTHGYYITWERREGDSGMPADGGAEIGWDWARAEREVAAERERYLCDHRDAS